MGGITPDFWDFFKYPEDAEDCIRKYGNRADDIVFPVFDKGFQYGSYPKITGIISRNGSYFAHICIDEIYITVPIEAPEKHGF